MRKGPVHDVPGDACVSCKECHRASCFYHIVHAYTLHSVQVLHGLRHDQTIHESHKAGKTKFQQKWEVYKQQEKEGKKPEEIQLSDLAQVFTTCKPLQPAFVRPGWYDEKIEIIHNAEGNLDHLKPENFSPTESVENVNSKTSESKGSKNKRKGLFLDYVLMKAPTDSRSIASSSTRTSEGETDNDDSTIQCIIPRDSSNTKDRRKRRKNSSPTSSSSKLTPALDSSSKITVSDTKPNRRHARA
ncbi:hypothetical protein L218DRAFT_142130 [Marasmius fiardii PR-910]|nr:hypothetical protein L218DRAFT_142130 [Marasmius fiardii PR-910]